MQEYDRISLNRFLEETCMLINAIASIVMQEFRDSIEKIGIKKSPIIDTPIKETEFENEKKIFWDNIRVYLESVDHLRDCVDCYFVMCR